MRVPDPQLHLLIAAIRPARAAAGDRPGREWISQTECTEVVGNGARYSGGFVWLCVRSTDRTPQKTLRRTARLRPEKFDGSPPSPSEERGSFSPGGVSRWPDFTIAPQALAL